MRIVFKILAFVFGWLFGVLALLSFYSGVLGIVFTKNTPEHTEFILTKFLTASLLGAASFFLFRFGFRKENAEDDVIDEEYLDKNL